MRTRRATQAGFTLIELVIVIAVIGILAAIAVPRFIDLRQEAAGSAADGVAGGVRSAIMIAAARAQADGQATIYPPNLEAAFVDFNEDGTLDGGTQPGAATACNVDPCFEAILADPIRDEDWTQTLAGTYVYTNAGVTRTCVYTASTGGFNCT